MKPLPLVIFTEFPLVPAEKLEDDFPYLQTQALMMLINEIEAWSHEAQAAIGDDHCRHVVDHWQWFGNVDNYLFSLVEEIQSGDPDVARCQLTADHDFYNSIDLLLDFPPTAEDVAMLMRDKIVARTLASLLSFWTENICHKLRELQAHLSGDGEVLQRLTRQKTLLKLPF